VDDGSTLTYDNFTVEYIHFEGAGGVGSSLPPSMSTPVPKPLPTSAPRSPATTSAAARSSPPPPQPVTPCTPTTTATLPGTSTPTPARVENPVEFSTSLSHGEERIDEYHDGEPLWYRTMENLLGDQSVPGLAPHDLEAQLHLTCDDGEPRLVARGFVQREGIDFDDTFAPVARIPIRATPFCAGCSGRLACSSHGRQVGVFNGDLKEEVYVY
jgi:hypothetical protein